MSDQSATLAVTTPIVHAEMLIGGKLVSAERRIEVRNPAQTSELVGTIPRGTPTHVDAAVKAARAALQEWSSLGFTARAGLLHPGIDAFEGLAPSWAQLYVRENGKVLGAALAEIAATRKRELNTLSYATTLAEPRRMPYANGISIVGVRPFGVVASIVPWNGPVVLGMTQIISALLAGNTVVVKPPETCPLTIISCLNRLAAGLPDGVINIVTGGRTDVGTPLVSHKGVDKIAFTGSIEAARSIIRDAADTIKNLTLELGGNDPALLLDDTPFDTATMDRLAGSVFRNCGQICLAVKRIYAPRARASEFEEAFIAAAGRFRVGNGLVKGIDLGPVHSRSSLSRIDGLVADAKQRGGVAVEAGIVDVSADDSCGYFCRPKIVLRADDSMRVVEEEQFAPIVPILYYDDAEEALARANRTIFGLGGSVWSADPERAERFAWRIEAGTVWVNAHGTTYLNPEAPYGGIKQSGIGRKSGIEGVKEYLQLQTLTIPN